MNDEFRFVRSSVLLLHYLYQQHWLYCAFQGPTVRGVCELAGEPETNSNRVNNYICKQIRWIIIGKFKKIKKQFEQTLFWLRFFELKKIKSLSQHELKQKKFVLYIHIT